MSPSDCTFLGSYHPYPADAYTITKIINNRHNPHKHYQPISCTNYYNPENLISIKPKPQASSRLPSLSKPSCDSGQFLFNPHAFKSRNGLGLTHLNIRSLCKQLKLDHLRTLVSQSEPDILVLTETWLKQNVHHSDVSLNNYNLYRIDSVWIGLLYIWSHVYLLLFYIATVPCSFEFIALKVNLSSNNSINVVVVYRPPSAVSCAINKLADLLSQYSNSEMLVLGDFNLN